MNKTELVDSIAESAGIPKTAAKKALDSVIDAISNALAEGDSVGITGFGTFSTLERQKRMGVNPATGKKMEIKAKRVAKFKPGKELKDLVAK